MQINYKSDESQSQFVDKIARSIYLAMGYKAPEDPNYLWKSDHPTERLMIGIAEDIFIMLTGDSPDYAEEEDDE